MAFQTNNEKDDRTWRDMSRHHFCLMENWHIVSNFEFRHFAIFRLCHVMKYNLYNLFVAIMQFIFLPNVSSTTRRRDPISWCDVWRGVAFLLVDWKNCRRWEEQKHKCNYNYSHNYNDNKGKLLDRRHWVEQSTSEPSTVVTGSNGRSYATTATVVTGINERQASQTNSRAMAR